MKIFRNDPKLASLFAKGKAPAPETLLGPKKELAEWQVTMQTGVLTVLYFFLGHRLCHRKWITAGESPDDVAGSNVFFRNYRWGWFKIAAGIFHLEDDGDNAPVTVIDYAVTRNNFLSQLICDHVRTVVDETKPPPDPDTLPDELIGRFHIKLGRWLIFLGYFSLTRIRVVTR